MRLVVSWLREFVDVPASAQNIADTLGLRGFEVASLEALPGGDAVIDFEVTANRPDCLNVLGLAREVATAYDSPITLPSTDPTARIPLHRMTTGNSDRVKVTLEDAGQSFADLMNGHLFILQGQGHSEFCAGDGGNWKALCQYSFEVMQ